MNHVLAGWGGILSDRRALAPPLADEWAIEACCDMSAVPKPVASSLDIRRATPADAAGIAAVLEVIAAERIYSAIDRAWTVEEERRYLESLAPREAIHVAVDNGRGIVGLQVLDRWSPSLTSMAHVGHVGTFVLPEWRGRGVGRQLWSTTLTFVRDAGYLKLVIQVRG